MNFILNLIKICLRFLHVDVRCYNLRFLYNEHFSSNYIPQTLNVLHVKLFLQNCILIKNFYALH